LAMIASGVYSIRTLLSLVSMDRIPFPMQKAFLRVGLMRASAERL
jgi:hypothetical protein